MTQSNRERMNHWKSLPNPKPVWEDWKRILGNVGNDTDKAWAICLKLMNKKLEGNLDKQ